MIFGIKPEIWFPVVTLILGALLKGFGDWLIESRRAKIDRDARLESRANELRAQMLEFQRTNLLEMQEAAQKLARATGKCQFEDVVAFRETGVWGKNLYSEEANDKSFEGTVLLTRFGVRAADVEIRQLVEKFKATCSTQVYSKSEDEGERCLSKVMALFEQLNERIGVLLRSHEEMLRE